VRAREASAAAEPRELPESAEGWVRTTMGEVATVVGGGTPDAKDPTNFCEEGGHAWLTPADLSDFGGTYVSRGRRNLSDKGLRTSSAKVMPKGAVLMSSRAPIGYTAVAANPICSNQGFKSFVCSEGLVPEYVLFWLRFIGPLLEEMGSGSTFAEISGLRAREIPILIAPTREQRRMVAQIEALMARVNAARERLAKVPAILKRFCQSVLAAACSGRLTEEWRGASTADETWRRLPIVDIAARRSRSIQSGPFGSNLHHSEFRDRGRLVIGIDNVGDGRFLPGKNHRIAGAKFQELEKYGARPLDVLVTVMATIGRCCVVPENIEPAIITKHVYRITVDPNLISPFLLAFALRGDPDVREQIQSQIRGQTRPGINGQILKSLVVPIPPLAEQEEIVHRVDALFKLADAIEERVKAVTARAEKLTQAILAKAFRGELVPTEAELARGEGRDYEPAAVLLERIRAERAKAEPSPRPSPRGRGRKRVHGARHNAAS
jgi:type I restriction enzyme S subunit